jgi:hypothetical protein
MLETIKQIFPSLSSRPQPLIWPEGMFWMRYKPVLILK